MGTNLNFYIAFFIKNIMNFTSNVIMNNLSERASEVMLNEITKQKLITPVF